MNGEPHTHDIVIRRELGDHGPLVVKYGDTTIHTMRIFGSPSFRSNHPSEKRVQACVRRAIKKHDKGSLKSARRAEKLNDYSAMAQNFNLSPDRWGSEQIKSS